MSNRTVLVSFAVFGLVVAACSGAVAEQLSGAEPGSALAPADGVLVPVDVMAEHSDTEIGHLDELVVPEAVAATEDHQASGHETEAVHPSTESSPAVIGTESFRTVEVKMSEFAFTPASVEVAAGESVKFVVANTGLVEHELRLSNAHRIEEHLASGHEGHGGGGHHEEADVFVTVAPGATAELLVTFPEDASLTEIACLIPGHYEAGMKAGVVYLEH